jgi:hypothetical protein
MADWTPRKTWIPTDDVLETYLNEQVYENTLWLYERPYQFIETTHTSPNETDATDYSAAGMTYKTLVTFAPFTLLEETTLSVVYNEMFSNSAARNAQIEPVLTLNGGAQYYYKTGTTTKPVYGSGTNDFRMTANVICAPQVRNRLTLTAGVWTLKLGYFASSGGSTLTRYSANYLGMGLLRVLY